MTPHLNHEQLCDLLLSNNATDSWTLASDELETSREHVRDCHICAGELASLSESLSIFRATANAWATHEWNHQSLLKSSQLKPQPARGISGLLHRPLVWAATAAAAIAIAVPFTLHQIDGRDAQENAVTVSPATPSGSAQPQSDEALFEEISQTVSYSVPAPMQPLADPTASRTGNTQRKN